MRALDGTFVMRMRICVTRVLTGDAVMLHAVLAHGNGRIGRPASHGAEACVIDYFSPYLGSAFHGSFSMLMVRSAQCPNSSSTTPIKRYTPRPRNG